MDIQLMMVWLVMLEPTWEIEILISIDEHVLKNAGETINHLHNTMFPLMAVFSPIYSPLSPPFEWFPTFVAVHSHTHLAAEWSQTD